MPCLGWRSGTDSYLSWSDRIAFTIFGHRGTALGSVALWGRALSFGGYLGKQDRLRCSVNTEKVDAREPVPSA